MDEAHCVSQWGHDFRPDYLHLAEVPRALASPVTLALTATATPRVQEDIIRLLGLPRAERVVTGFNRSNLAFEVAYAPDVRSKLNFLAESLRSDKGPGIVYVGTRRDAEEVAAFIRDTLGQRAEHYHGALDGRTRARVQDAFLAGELPFVIATNAFGMGIDRPDVRFVVHYALPGTLEAYYQEAGRAGRDGLPAQALLLYSPRDSSLQEFFIDNDSPSAADLRAVHAFIRKTPSATRDEIERATGLPDTKVRVALEQLAIAGALRRKADGPFGAIQLEVLPLSDSGLEAIARQVAARRQHRRRQLSKMVDYAQTNACRRRILLDYFGDRSAADAERCCDNCLDRAETTAGASRPAQTRTEYAALIVLDTVRRLPWATGRTKLAQLLKGSRAKDAAPYRTARYYGKFASLDQSDIESLIEQLLRLGHLKQVGGTRPVIQLTARGESTLKARTAIEVRLRGLARPLAGAQQRQPSAQSAGLPSGNRSG